jgi:type IV secretory pathway TrbD component
VLPSESMRRVSDEDPLLFVAERARATLNRVVAYLVIYVVCVCVLVLVGFVILSPPAP